jgi:hypothetical protein
VVDPDIDVVRVYRLAEGKYERRQDVAVIERQLSRMPRLPGLEMPLAEIFAD